MKNTKKSMLASGLAVLVCVAMLIGTTFAWFTDSVTNSGNTIKAGSLAIDANAYDIGEGGLTVTGLTDIAPATVTFEENGQNLKQDATPILTEENWEPGQSNAKLLKLKNSGTLNAKVQLNFDISGDLTDALWYDFVQVNPESGAAVGQCTKRAMSTLPELAAARELTLAPGAEVAFVFAYGMNTDAGNDYQNGTFQANVSIAAKQAPVEKDGFGSDQYDKDATYYTTVSSAEDFTAALESGNPVKLAEDVTVNGALPLSSTESTEINLDGNKLTVDNTATIALQNAASLTIENGDLNVRQTSTNPTVAAFNVQSGSSVTLNNVNFETNGAALYPQGDASTVTVINSTITAPVYCVATNAGKADNYNVIINLIHSTFTTTDPSGDSCPVMINIPGVLNMTNCTVNGNRQAVLVRGGTAVLENCTLNSAGTYANPDEYLDKTWGSGNNLPAAALVVGNRSNSYQYAAVCTLKNTTVTSANGGRTVYIYGNTAAGLGATLNYDGASVVGEIQGKQNCTINGQVF